MIDMNLSLSVTHARTHTHTVSQCPKIAGHICIHIHTSGLVPLIVSLDWESDHFIFVFLHIAVYQPQQGYGAVPQAPPQGGYGPPPQGGYPQAAPQPAGAMPTYQYNVTMQQPVATQQVVVVGGCPACRVLS